MTRTSSSINRVRESRIAAGLTQADLAARAGISRTAVTAIEGGRLVPSVAAALAVADALNQTVESLFSPPSQLTESKVWAWQPLRPSSPVWRAQVGETTVLYPAGSSPMITPLPDEDSDRSSKSARDVADRTLVIACCDPAAGILAGQFAAETGLRLLVLPRSSREALAMLRDGLVHMAGLHLSTQEEPLRNAELVGAELGPGHQLIRIARWQEGITLARSAGVRSVRGALRSKLRWVGREAGSGARDCLDRLLPNRTPPRHLARHHRGVAEAVQSGWADAGVCLQLVSEEAGLDFLPVQEEAYDVCYPASLAGDRRLQAFLSVVRSRAYRRLLGGLPGYNTTDTGEVWNSN